MRTANRPICSAPTNKVAIFCRQFSTVWNLAAGGFLGRGVLGNSRHYPRAACGVSRRHRRHRDHADRRRPAHIPAILIALLIDGVVKAVLGSNLDAGTTLAVLVVSIGLSFWVQYARTVRGSVMVEKNKDYIAAARLIGLPASAIMLKHILPNVTGPVLVIATINLALAVITEATLSFLGTGMPETMPSLGTLIRIGNNYLFSGEWWIVAFPGIALAVLVLAINLLGDWLRDALNPKLR